MKKLLLIGAVAGAVVGAKKLRQRVQEDGGLKVTKRKARRQARRLQAKAKWATGVGVAKVTELVNKEPTSAAQRHATAKSAS